MVGVPAAIIPALREHLAIFAKDDPGALVFPGANRFDGKPTRAGGSANDRRCPYSHYLGPVPVGCQKSACPVSCSDGQG